MPSKSSNGPSLTLTLFADLERDQGARGVFALLDAVEDGVDLGIAHRHRPALRPQEPGDTVDRVDQVITAVRHLHMHQHIAGA
jgi:hypothetical protein